MKTLCKTGQKYPLPQAMRVKEETFIFLQRVSVLHSAVLLHDTLPATDCTDWWSVLNIVYLSFSSPSGTYLPKVWGILVMQVTVVMRQFIRHCNATSLVWVCWEGMSSVVDGMRTGTKIKWTETAHYTHMRALRTPQPCAIIHTHSGLRLRVEQWVY